ncbi:MAG: 23S rRNA (adenine(2030)-N(6))-methyltransferase RlmJ [Caulobacteraceae bacterium]|nr:23S rRNA (adenine(2030)-N(6))-methyltransferase RlmJ [Caulobacteraceae bacterium]
MNYRHAFHAGNFADLVKHAALTRLMQRLTAAAAPLLVVDTHAGAGLYDLTDADQARSREAEAGIARLSGLDLPPEFALLKQAVDSRNGGGAVRRYPGSPLLVCDALRRGDRYIGCEMSGEVFARLGAVLRGTGKDARGLRGDGYEALPQLLEDAERRLFVLIDPPFEQADDYLRIVEALSEVFAVRPDAAAMVWLPLKDLETLDGFVRRMESAGLPEAVVAEARLRRLDNPMKMNGCALAVFNAPDGFEHDLRAICRFVVQALGEPGGQAKLWVA